MDYQNNYEQTQLNITVGQAFNNAILLLSDKYKDTRQVNSEELIELTKRLAQDILTARKEFAGELPDMKIIEAIKNVNKERPLISFEITDFEKASEPQKTLINEVKLLCNRLNNLERRPKGTHAEFADTARKHFNAEENDINELIKVGDK